MGIGCLNGEYIRYRLGEVMVYEHRLVARIAWGPRVPFPAASCDIHHLDGCATHNCRSNLLIIDTRLHRAFNKGRTGRKNRL